MTVAPTYEPLGKCQSKKTAVSGWVGSALEYYSFFIYATAAVLIFPQISSPKGDPKAAIIASLAMYGVGYITRPIGAFVLGHLGDTHGRKGVPLWCMFLMDFSTIVVGLLPTYDQVGLLAPALLVIMRPVQGFVVTGEISGAGSMILEHAPLDRRGFYVSFTLQDVQAGQILTTIVLLSLAHCMPAERFNTWGWYIPFVLDSMVIIAGYVVRREAHETPTFTTEKEQQARPHSPVIDVFKCSTPNMLRVMCMALMNVIPVVAIISGMACIMQSAYGIGFAKDVYLWVPVMDSIVAVLVVPYAGDLSDRIGRKPPIVISSLSAGLLASAYLYAISTKNALLAFTMPILMQGVVYQSYSAVLPSPYPELLPMCTRMSTTAISRNINTAIIAVLSTIFTVIAPPEATNIWLTIGAIALGVTMAATAAATSTHEIYHIHIDELD